MSNLDLRPAAAECAAAPSGPVRELQRGREVPLGESTVVRRLLPTLGRRMVGAWCFVDHYGPDDIADEPGMQVPPHPHIGLQTVSWLHEGEVLHRDSLGSLRTIRPRQLGLMTSGRAISHSEESPRPHAHAPLLHGAQLWVALPDEQRHTAPSFEFHAELPGIAGGGGLRATVILGSLDGATSPGTVYTPLMGADIAVVEGTDARLPVEEEFEYAALAMDGEAEVDGVPLPRGSLLYLGTGRRELPVRATADASFMLLGGVPFDERLVMWWNFIGRTHDEIAAAREDWASGTRFGTVTGYDGTPLAAPPLPATTLKARGRVR
ncbi:pirin family protein [Streptomyces radicis]|uniref:Pirin family protein n=1 Tax=Streptomyces radicis TaxID=1750517 RepID=A0A3A9WCH5_9ACTN|nr:pirin family protein [Streptomyces radicis]RKN05336.1 pirin family protein [Streptomyces radicis]RKN16843.1 pirin family protein [Streptomyces radicis]